MNICSQHREAKSTTAGLSRKSPEVIPVSDLLPLKPFYPGKSSAAEESKHTDTSRDEIVLEIVAGYLITLSTRRLHYYFGEKPPLPKKKLLVEFGLPQP